MKTFRFWITIGMVLAFLVAPLPLVVRQAAATPVYTCLPSCDTADGRFMSMAGYQLSTMANTNVSVQVIVPSNVTSFEIGIFDGDTGGMWDEKTTISEYVLYNDPKMSGDSAQQVGYWLGKDLPDNAWSSTNISTSEDARGESGNFYYHMEVRTLSAEAYYWNNFKLRTDGLAVVMPRVFAFTAGLHTAPELPIIYPNYPTNLESSTYDGSFSFRIFAPTSMSSFEIWDGDMDFGSYDLGMKDTDDPDTPNDVRPPWTAVETTQYEGVAVGVASTGVTGLPADDVKSPYARRSPSVSYEVKTPSGEVFVNSNPSGNKEWEQFRIETDPAVPADHIVSELLPSGMYTVKILGMDMHNLNTWRFPYYALGECEDEDLCKELEFPFLVGDTVFYDLNGNGIQDEGEEGIPEVKLNLLDGNGMQMVGQDGLPITILTDPDGKYSFDVHGKLYDVVSGELIIDGVYTVQVAPENFAPGGVLAGLFSSTGGEEHTETVIDASVWSYDFGYAGPAEIGDLVWLDSDGDGVYDPVTGEIGIPNASLLLSNGNATLTGSSGLYDFGGLGAGGYTVNVDPASLPAGLVPTYDFDGLATPNVAMLALLPGQSQLGIDFGYRPSSPLGTGTIGFWKNHSEAWPVEVITIGGVAYTKQAAIKLMGKSTSTDKTYNLFAQLVAAKLNVGLGNPSSCIEATILAADNWMAEHPVGSGVSASSPAWQSISAAYTMLDQYNNGMLCAPHRD